MKTNPSLLVRLASALILGVALVLPSPAAEPPPLPAAASVPEATGEPLEVWWTYPASKLSTNLVFKVRSSPVLQSAKADYPVVATYAVTNLVQTNFAYLFPNQMQGEYFVVEVLNTNRNASVFSPVVRDDPALSAANDFGMRRQAK